MDNINANDTVVCVNNSGISNLLTVGKLYLVDSVSPTKDGVFVICDTGCLYGFLNKRFKVSLQTKPDIDYLQLAKDVASHV